MNQQLDRGPPPWFSEFVVGFNSTLTSTKEEIMNKLGGIEVKLNNLETEFVQFKENSGEGISELIFFHICFVL